MNNDQFIKILSDKTSLKPKDVKNILKNFNTIVSESIKNGDDIRIPDFGVLFRLDQKARTIVDPRNRSNKLIIPPQKTVKFTPSQSFRFESQNIKLKNIENKEVNMKDDLDFSYGLAKPVFVPYIDLSQMKIPRDVLNYIPEQMARKFQIAPVQVENNTLVLAMIDPQDQEALEFIKKKTNMKVEPRICTQRDLNSIFDQYSGLPTEVAEIVEKTKEKDTKKDSQDQAEEIAEGTPVAKVVSSLIKRAVRSRSSDIHIEPQEEEVWVRFRIDGILKKVITLPKNIQNSVTSRIKILSSMKIDETRLPQDGHLRAVVDQEDIDFRISTLPNINGEKIVMRILDKTQGLLTLEQLGLRGNAFESLNGNIEKTHGMILVTGPTGSGKTTSLYAMIQKLMTEGINIVTLEDPVEYNIKGINQSMVRSDIGFTFANGLRSIVRQDPDLIMIGEIRDYETADMAIHAALTGHVVLSTLHTNDAAGAIPRLIDMKIEPFLLASTLNAIIAQRLARKICPKCIEETTLPKEELEVIKDIMVGCKEYDNRKISFFHGKGCDACSGTGYQGRIGIFEVLPVTEKIKNLITSRCSSDLLQKEAIANGMVNLKQDGILKAIDGLTTIEEVWRVTKD